MAKKSKAELAEKDRADEANRKSLAAAGVKDQIHQDILIAHSPCGCEAYEALRDSTTVQINAPRALIICYWKGMVFALATAESVREQLAAQRRGGE